MCRRRNIVVGVDGVPRVLDFGVAKAAGKLQTTKLGQIKGKNRLHGARTTDPSRPRRARRCLRLRRRPMGGAHRPEALRCRQRGRRPGSSPRGPRASPPSQYAPAISPELDAIVMKALETDPEERSATALEMALALEAAVPLPRAHEIGEWVARVAAASLARARRRESAAWKSAKSQRTHPTRNGKVPTELRGGREVESAPVVRSTEGESAAPPRRNMRILPLVGVGIAALGIGAGALFTAQRYVANAQPLPPASSAPLSPAPEAQPVIAASQVIRAPAPESATSAGGATEHGDSPPLERRDRQGKPLRPNRSTAIHLIRWTVTGRCIGGLNVAEPRRL